MTHRLKTTGRTARVFMALLAVTALTFSSCTKPKKNDNQADKFLGTYTGTSDCASGTITITLSGSGNTINIPGSVGSGTCEKAITLNVTANGNNLAGSQTYTDNCGNPMTVSFSGSLNGNTLTFVFSGTGVGSCTFTGTK